jgi:hypothetical protein
VKKVLTEVLRSKRSSEKQAPPPGAGEILAAQLDIPVAE